ncbi:MAG: hypothetical protein AB1634_15055 [Thermodesulfobacteriota bacterium]
MSTLIPTFRRRNGKPSAPVFWCRPEATSRQAAISRHELRQKINETYPDIGACGIDVEVELDQDNRAWAVNLRKDQHAWTTLIEIDEARHCIQGRKCLFLALQISEFKRSLERPGAPPATLRP